MVNGYDITLTQLPDDFEGEKLFLTGYYGMERYVIDSCVIKKGTLQFKNKKNTLPCGVYLVADDTLFLPFLKVILNKSNRCLATWDKEKGKFNITNNEETLLLYTFNKRIENVKSLEEARSLFDEYTNSAPASFVSKYITAVDGYSINNTNNSSSDQYRWTCPYALKDLPYTDLSEPRLLYSFCRLSIHIDQITECDDYDSDYLIQRMDSVLQRCTNEIVKNYYCYRFYDMFNVHNPDFDPVLVYLCDTYGYDWAGEDSSRIKRKINHLRKILPGAQIPELISHDKEGKAHSTNDITTKYTVLWFWDPDCDHCQEMTPVLHQIYQDYAAEKDFEVFAVEVNDDYDRWVAFSDIHQLWDWTNLSTAMGDQNIDFYEYFDIMTTPVLFLIDNSNNHTIIARQVTLDELRTLLNIEN